MRSATVYVLVPGVVPVQIAADRLAACRYQPQQAP